jgi:hypothetical protein
MKLKIHYWRIGGLLILLLIIVFGLIGILQFR